MIFPVQLFGNPILFPHGATIFQHRFPRTAWLLVAWIFAGCALSSPARAEGVPIVVERYDAAIGARDAAAVMRGDFDEHLHPESAATVTPSHRTTTWYRVRLADDWLSPHEPALVISEASDIVVHVYAPPDYAGAEYSVYHNGGLGRARHMLIVPLMGGWRASSPLYLRMDSATTTEHELSVTDMATAQEAELTQLLYDIVWPIAQVALLLAALVVLRPWRQPANLLFLGQTFGIAVATLYKFGVGFEYWPLSLLAPLGIKANALAVAATMAFALAFARTFLDLPRRAPALARMNDAGVALFTLFAIACILPLPWPDWLLMSTLATLMLFGMALILSSGIFGWLRGQRGAATFVCGWTPAALMMIVRTLCLMTQTPTPSWLMATMPALFAFLTIALLHALALRMPGSAAPGTADIPERDALTGALARRATFAHLRQAFVEARSRRRPLSILSIETCASLRERAQPHGRGALDACLLAIMACLAEELRDQDLVGRRGDDQLLVILPGVDLVGAQSITQRFERRVAECVARLGSERVGVAADVGVASLADDVVTPDALLARADVERCSGRLSASCVVGAT